MWQGHFKHLLKFIVNLNRNSYIQDKLGNCSVSNNFFPIGYVALVKVLKAGKADGLDGLCSVYFKFAST